MPYSDNLYSMSDDSDGEDYADQLSPSDGYFASSSSSNAVPRIPNVMVPDPTLQQRSETDAGSKAREADEERVLNTQRHQAARPAEPASPRESGQSENIITSSGAPPDRNSTHTYSPSSATRTPIRTLPTRGRTPSVYSDAPPAYTPSPTSPLSATRTGQDTQARNYSTFSTNMAVGDVENERLLESQPESMSQPVDEEAGTPVWRRRVRRRLPAWLNWRVTLLALVVLIVSIGFLASTFRIVKGDNPKTIGPAEPVEKQPVELPPQDPENPEEPSAPPETPAPFEPTFCDGEQHRFSDQVLALNFDKSHNVTFSEGQHVHSGSKYVRVGGQVDVRRLDRGGDPRVVLEITTNEKDLLLDVLADEEQQFMQVSIPQKYDSSVADQMPCVEMRATIWVPEGAEVGVLSVGVMHLDILLLDDLSLHVADYSRISSITGDISSGSSKPVTYEHPGLASTGDPDYTFVPAKDSYQFDSRVIEASTTSGTLGGNWPLYDMLGLHTTSGDIKVSISPKDEIGSDPKSAVLSLSSISGAVHATEPVHLTEQIPLRDYLVDIKSTSGGIHGAFAFGAGIELKSTASEIALDLLPVMNLAKLSASQPAQMETATTSGTTAVRVLDPVWFGATESKQPQGAPSATTDDGQLLADSVSKPFNCLQAIHKSTSGDIGLRYPQAWEGELHAETTSGELKVKGKDVKILKSSGGWGASKMEARKGPAGPGSIIQVHALMGTLDAVIGEEK